MSGILPLQGFSGNSTTIKSDTTAVPDKQKTLDSISEGIDTADKSFIRRAYEKVSDTVTDAGKTVKGVFIGLKRGTKQAVNEMVTGHSRVACEAAGIKGTDLTLSQKLAKAVIYSSAVLGGAVGMLISPTGALLGFLLAPGATGGILEAGRGVVKGAQEGIDKAKSISQSVKDTVSEHLGETAGKAAGTVSGVASGMLLAPAFSLLAPFRESFSYGKRATEIADENSTNKDLKSLRKTCLYANTAIGTYKSASVGLAVSLLMGANPLAGLAAGALFGLITFPGASSAAGAGIQRAFDGFEKGFTEGFSEAKSR